MLRRNMLMTVILVSFAPLLFAITVIGYHFESSYREKVLAHLVELVEKHQQNINIYLNEKLMYVRVLANTFTLEQLKSEDFLQHKLAILQRIYGGEFVDIGLVDDSGVQIAYAGTFRLGKADYSQSDWFKKAIEKPYYISDVFLGLRKEPHFIVASRQETDGRKYILRATIDFEAFNSLVGSIRVGKTGLAFIINTEGEFQTKPLKVPALGQEFFVKLLSENRSGGGRLYGPFEGMLRDALDLPTDFSRRSDISVGQARYGNRDAIYVMTPLKSGEWILAYQQEKWDTFPDLYNSRQLAVLTILLGGLAIVVMAFVVSQRTVRRIEKSDQEKEMMNEQVIEAGKLASIGELAAGIAHEINNPVAIMVEEAGWMGDLLDEEGVGDCLNMSEFNESLHQIKVQGERCKDITHKLLSFARSTDPRMREVQINDLVEEVVGVCEQRSRYANVKIAAHLAPGLPIISASPSEMQQVLLNLINNAIDALGRNGGAVDITTRMDGDKVIVDVTDNGQGIPKAIMPRIFDPFFTTKPVGKGTGLGLSICYGIIKRIGGDITINSAVGAGTSFHIQLPVMPYDDQNNVEETETEKEIILKSSH